MVFLEWKLLWFAALCLLSCRSLREKSSRSPGAPACNSKEPTQVMSKPMPGSVDFLVQPRQGCSRMSPAPHGSAVAHPQALPPAPWVVGWFHCPTASTPDVRAGCGCELCCGHLNYCSPTLSHPLHPLSLTTLWQYTDNLFIISSDEPPDIVFLPFTGCQSPICLPSG